MRNDGNTKHYHLKPAFTETIDKKINQLEKKARMIKKLMVIINTVKANGMYSQKELNTDLMKMEQLHTDEKEVDLIVKCWDVRKKAGDKLMVEADVLLDEINKEFE